MKANEEHTEGQILLQNKLVELKDVGAGSEMDNKIKLIEKKCSKRMKKLIRKQRETIGVFHQTWEEKKLKLEEDHKLESALIRCLHGQGSVGIDKLKRLDDKFARKLEEHHLIKDAQLKDLEAEQVASMNEEIHKATYWHTTAIAWRDKLRACSGPRSLGSQSEDYAGCSQSAMHTVIDSMDIVSISSQQIQDQNSNQGNDMASCSRSISAPLEAVGCDASVETRNNTNCPNDTAEGSSFYEVEKLNQSKQSMDGVEQLNPLKQSSEAADMVCEKTPDSGEGVPFESESVEPNKEVPVGVSETVLNKNVGHVSKDKAHPSSMELQDKNVAVIENQCVSHIAVADLEPFSIQFNNKPQDQDGPAMEHQSTSQSANSELVDIVNPVQSIVEQQVGDAPAVENRSITLPEVAISGLGNVVTPAPSVPSNTRVPAPDNSEQVDQLSVEDCPSYNLCPAVHQNSDQGTDSHEFNSQSRENLISVTDPLQNELERMRKEKEHLEKSSEDMVSQLKSDFEKEIQEIHNKYKTKLQDVEANLISKKNELEKNRNKALRNKLLAEAFRFWCLNPMPPELPGMQQGIVPSSFMQQQSPQPSVRVPLGESSTFRPCSSTSPAEIAMPHIPVLPQYSTRASSPVAVQNVTPPALQRVQHTSALFPGTPSRPPPIISTIRITPARDPRVCREIRSVAPHLRPFRPSAASSVSRQQPVVPQPSQPPAPLVTSDLETSGNVQGSSNHTSSADVVCLSDDE